MSQGVSVPERDQLRYLLKLLDDESPTVRENVLKELEAFGGSLEEEIARSGIRLSNQDRVTLRPLLDEQRKVRLQTTWPQWLAQENDKQQLETALSLLAEFQLGPQYPLKLTATLDEIARTFTITHRECDALELSHFLFQEMALGGVPQNDYYHPLNSNLVYTLQHHRGIPISLVCIYILIGHRLGVRVEGCNFPGHFLAIAPMRKRRVLVDCFNGGRVIRGEDLEAIGAKISLKDILQLECNAPAIVARVLRNLVNAYEQSGDEKNAELMAWLLHSFTEQQQGPDVM
jgi:regulator of sirC expression with transglutaminase-like and TPR domain